MTPRVMFLEIETFRSIEDPSIYGDQYVSCGAVVEGNWDNLNSAGVSVMAVYDTTFADFKIYTAETVREGVDKLRGADLIVGYNLRDYSYIVLSEYGNYSLQKLPTFDIQHEMRFLQGKEDGVHWVREKEKIPFVSLSNIAKWTCDKTIYTSKEMSELWLAGAKDRVVQYVKERVQTLQEIFNHACKHGSISYWKPGAKKKEPVILPTPMWRHKARSIVESEVPKTYLRDEETVFDDPPDRMFALPNPSEGINKIKETLAEGKTKKHVLKIDSNKEKSRKPKLIFGKSVPKQLFFKF